MATTVIDGHNLIAALPDISLADPDDEAQLLAKLEQAFAGARGRVVAVFDPGANPPVAPLPYQGRIEAVYARRPDRADDVIMRLIRADPNPRHVTVVTGDREILACAHRHRCRVVKPVDFFAVVRRARRPPSPPEGKTAAPTGELATETYLQYWYDYFEVPPQEREAEC